MEINIHLDRRAILPKINQFFLMKKVYLLIGLIGAFSIFAFGTTVLAGDFGLSETAGAAKLDTYGDSVPTIAGNVIGTLLSMISVLFFVLVLYGGILWMTARGSSETTEKALNTIIAATIGIIIVIGAYALTNFVFKLGTNTGGGGPPLAGADARCGNGIIEGGEQCDGDDECTATCTCTTPDCGGNTGGDTAGDTGSCAELISCTDIMTSDDDQSVAGCMEAADLGLCVYQMCDEDDTVCQTSGVAQFNSAGEVGFYWQCLDDPNGGCAKFNENMCEQSSVQGNRGEYCEWEN